MITRPFGESGPDVAVIGQGTWRMGETRGAEKEEVTALRLGLELGLTHIDTAEMYADGGAERVVARAIAGRRDQVFLVTKVLPSNASRQGTIRACEAALKRLRTDHVDAYLLHWWSDRHPIDATMEAMGELVRRGLARHVGVVGYTPLARGGFLRPAITEIARRRGVTPRQVALNFLVRRKSLFTIPKAGRREHVREKAAALDFTLTRGEIAAIDREHA